jgi:SAM-dependent methyltransferase
MASEQCHATSALARTIGDAVLLRSGEFAAATRENGAVSDIANYWNEQAAGFDDAPDHGLRDSATRSAWASLLIPLMPAAPARIADVGCGTGSLAVLLAEAGYRVSGLDLAPAMVKRAQAKAAQAGVDAEFMVADAIAPPWQVGSFDAVLARHVLWALPDPAIGLDAWLELLKPDGRVILIEGRWWNGAGLAGRDVLRLFESRGRDAALTALDDPVLWGGPVDDERYLIVSPPARALGDGR